MYYKLILLPLFACLFFFSSFAQPKVPEHVFYQKLDNGLEVMVLEDHTIPFSTIEIACKNGSFTEDNEYNGLSHLYEHMFFKANKEYKSQEDFLKATDKLDMAYNGQTLEESVTYYFTLPKENTVKGLEFMNAAIRYPKFKKSDMLEENPIVNAEFQRQESSPYFVLIDTLNHLLWGNNYSRKNIIGNHDVILSATPEKMEIIKNKFYYPNNCLLIVAGDVEHSEIFSKVDNIYGSWKSSTFDPAKEYPVPEIEPLKKNSYVVIESPLTESPLLIMRWHGPDMRNDIQGTYTADVFSYILNQRMSRLTQALQETGLANDIQINYYSQKYVGPITFSVSPNPAKIKECYQAMQKEIAQWDDDNYISDKQLERAKRILYITQVEEREEVERYVHLISFWWACASTDYYTFYRENMSKVTPADIKNYVRKYIKGRFSCTGLIIPKGSNLPTDPNFYFSK
ncbi:M16 family metallopeptidase [Ferruginibacter sp. SUN106]|uniref:M16 family metallopeptidase n=1 Tax=Ferruginibacter sp. SUN106 TaxID=2978348 RepID=UPI003D36B6E2